MLQVKQGAHAGRLLSVGAVTGSDFVDTIAYSDDDAATWTPVEHMFPRTMEAQLTQLPNGSIMFNARHENETTLGRAVAISQNADDGGLSWSALHHDPVLVGPVCEGSIVSFNGTVYFSNPSTHGPANLDGRHNITIRRSVDNAASWTSSLLVDDHRGGDVGAFGYTSLVDAPLIRSPTGRGGILWEAWNGSIKFARFDLGF